MLLQKERLEHAQIMSLQTGALIAETSASIIDPRELKVVGFYCTGPRLDINPAILLSDDIREIGSIGIIVDSADVFMLPEDLVRLKDVLSYGFRLEDKHVIDDSGHKLGKVSSYTLDSDSLFIIKLQVHPGMWRSLGTTELIIDRSQIVQVTDHEVLVKSTRKKQTEQAAPPVLENPFRNSPAEGAPTSHAER
ncbi:MAG TPA: hypothetical protein VM581_00550 [Magnetospirillaceae bacterium]|nr:hypothetical protein [Magnetospirillaceae bacterium]